MPNNIYQILYSCLEPYPILLLRFEYDLNVPPGLIVIGGLVHRMPAFLEGEFSCNTLIILM